MKLTKWNSGIGIVIVTMQIYSCNIVKGGSDNNSQKATIAGLAILASLQGGLSAKTALVMPECGKGLYTGETFADFTKLVTLHQTASLPGVEFADFSQFTVFDPTGLPGCTPISFSSTDGVSGTMTYNENRQLRTYTISGSTTTISYNSLNYIASSQTTCTNATAGNITLEYFYDSLGRLSKITKTTPSECLTDADSPAGFSQTDDYTYFGGELMPATIVKSYNASLCKETIAYNYTKNSLGYLATRSFSQIGFSSVSNSSDSTRCRPEASSGEKSSYYYDSNGNISDIYAKPIVIAPNALPGSFNSKNTYDSSNRVLASDWSLIHQSPKPFPYYGFTKFTYNFTGQLVSINVSGNFIKINRTYSY